ncbi:hypothetical protein K7A42_21395 [Agrobacterium sp. InxBP2]|uniref:hypothetical protein n=1 Tax=Agrobacterium sp. InxBP2 TaxID=2870329 RepID=UPI00249E9F34|nr:hypothetical protein [Agrobacterium sp. InxBP2]MCW8283457.1 hypothetical protein [Agrobacterium sp. InxBP2]
MQKRIAEKSSQSDLPIWSVVPGRNVETPEDQAKRDARDIAGRFREDLLKTLSSAKIKA